MTYIKIDENDYLNDNNLRKILSLSGELLKGENCYQITKFPGVIESKHDIVFNLSKNKIQYKTEDQKQQELIEKQSAEILTSLLPLMTAMNIQENGKNKGVDPLKAMFSDTEIKEWSEYIADIAAGNIGEMPELNNIAKKIFGL